MSIRIEDFQKQIKVERDIFFKSSFERAYQAFCELKYDEKEAEFFQKNASEIVNSMRAQCWADFLVEEKAFTSHMLEYLIENENYNGLSNIDSIKKYVKEFPDHIYQLCLSNTQSRRSRAGKEFEHIIELVLIGAGVPLDSQGNIGKDYFVEKGLGKLVDTVSPGVIEFEINKRNSVLISAKTTLRERWQEVPEEMGRTGAREMFLATLDEKVSADVLNTLYEANIQLTTTSFNKEINFKNNNRVLSFEELIKICLDNAAKWKGFEYSVSQANQAIETINKQIIRHDDHVFVKESLKKRIALYSIFIAAKKENDRKD
ncbi:EcoRII C terminal [Lachnospiraceae bacterium]|nr:EcoRII C terminal [Lachnospiraceae bacterium]